MRIAIFISGKGSNAGALIKEAERQDFPGEISLLLSNRPKAGGLALAEAHAIPSEVVDHRNFDTREAFDARLHDVLKDYQIDLVCLAGFMRLLTAEFVSRWRDKILNVHPSLLPSYKGLDTHARALEDGVKLSGCTVHFVRAEMDNGPILGQAAVPVLPGDTPELLTDRVKAAEHILYPKALRLVVEGKARVRGQRVQIDGTLPLQAPLINPLP